MESGNLTLSVGRFKTAKTTSEDALFSPQCKEERTMLVFKKSNAQQVDELRLQEP